jgi:hypothetical protein
LPPIQTLAANRRMLQLCFFVVAFKVLLATSMRGTDQGGPGRGTHQFELCQQGLLTSDKEEPDRILLCVCASM